MIIKVKEKANVQKIKVEIADDIQSDALREATMSPEDLLIKKEDAEEKQEVLN